MDLEGGDTKFPVLVSLVGVGCRVGGMGSHLQPGPRNLETGRFRTMILGGGYFV